MVIDLAAPETCFQAESAEECYVALRIWKNTLYPAQNASLASTVIGMCSSEMTPNIERLVSHMSILNMFTVAVGMSISCALRLWTNHWLERSTH